MIFFLLENRNFVLGGIQKGGGLDPTLFFPFMNAGRICVNDANSQLSLLLLLLLVPQPKKRSSNPREAKERIKLKPSSSFNPEYECMYVCMCACFLPAYGFALRCSLCPHPLLLCFAGLVGFWPYRMGLLSVL